MTHTILFLAANPRDTDPLAIQEECRAIEHELSLSEVRSELDFRSKWAVSVEDMMRYLNKLRPTVLHFSGHGSRGSRMPRAHSAPHRDVEYVQSAGIFLQDRDRSQHVSERALGKLIASASPSTRLVVLNACYSAAVAESLRQVIDCVVGIDGAIQDVAARSFAAAFYRALGFRRSVRNAVDQAAATLDALQYADHLPSWHTRDGLHGDQIFLIEPSVGIEVRPPLGPVGIVEDVGSGVPGELFLAHPPANKSSAAALYDLLQPEVGVFLAARSLQPSEQWDQEVRAAQRAARATALMISRQADPAWYFGHEVLTAIALHRASPAAHGLVLVRLEPGVSVPHILSDLPSIDATAGGGLAGIAGELRELVRNLRRHPPPRSSASPPGDPVTASGVRTRSDPFRLYRRLGQLADAVFDQLVGDAGLDRATLAPRTTPLGDRALDIALRAALDSTLYRRVLTQLDRRAPWS